MDVEELDHTEHIKWGVGVVFESYPDETLMLSTMADIRKVLKEKSNGNIYWHIVQTEEGWHLSGNIAAASNGVMATEPEPKQTAKATSNTPLQTSEENFLRDKSYEGY